MEGKSRSSIRSVVRKRQHYARINDVHFAQTAGVHTQRVMLQPGAGNDWAKRWDVDANQERDVGGEVVISCILGHQSESLSVLFLEAATKPSCPYHHMEISKSVSLDNYLLEIIHGRSS